MSSSSRPPYRSSKSYDETDWKETEKVSVLERLIRTHPVWFLPRLSREEAHEVLLGKHPGVFVVRQSSQANTMALSVKLPHDANFNQGAKHNGDARDSSVEHFLIEPVHGTDSSDGNNQDVKVKLESSSNAFDNILSLVYHYFTSREELPVLLSLPKALKDTESRQTLTSLSLLGKDFWRYPMSFSVGENADSSPSKSKMGEGAAVNSVASTALPDVLPAGEKHTPGSSTHLESHVKATGLTASSGEPKCNSLLEETLMGLQEVSELLQQSLLDLRRSGSANDNVVSSVATDAKKGDSSRLRRRSDSHLSSSAGSFHTRQTPAALLMQGINEGTPVTCGAKMTSLKVIPDEIYPGISSVASPPARPVTPSRRSRSPAASVLTPGSNTAASAAPAKLPIPSNCTRNSARNQQRRRRKVTAPPSVPIQWNYPGDASRGSARGCDDSGTFYHSSISDKMSDYEDIWSSNGETMSRGAAQASASSKGNNLPGACNRDHRSSSAMSSSAADRPMTPAESESHLKTYLASKLLSGQCELESSQVSCPSLGEDKMESSQFSVITEDFGGISTTSASFCSVELFSPTQPPQHSSSISNSSSNSLGSSSKSSYISTTSTSSSTVTSVASKQSSSSSAVSASPPHHSLSSSHKNADSSQNVSISSITSKSLKSNLLLSDNIDKICEPVYSDPLDALEEEDEDIYESLEDVIKDDERIASDHESSEDEYDDLKIETRSMSSDILAGCALDGDGSLKNNSPEVPRAVSAESLEAKKEVVTGKRLSAVRKTSKRLSSVLLGGGGSGSGSPRATDQPSDRQKGTNWQLDSSSWEFLGNAGTEAAGDSTVISEIEEGILMADERDDAAISLIEELPSIAAPSPYENMFDSHDLSGVSDKTFDASDELMEKDTTFNKKSASESHQTLKETVEDEEKKNLDTLDVEGLDVTTESATQHIQRFVRNLVIAPRERETSQTETKNSPEPCQKTSLLRNMIDNFISCTLLSIETAEINRPLNNKSIGRPPIHIVRVFKNVKQFLSGAKNYLVKTGEGDFFKLVEEEKAKLLGDNILSLDGILEDVLQQLVIPPLRPHILTLYVAPTNPSCWDGPSDEFPHDPEVQYPDQASPNDHLIKKNLKALAEDIHLSLLQKWNLLRGLVKDIGELIESKNPSSLASTMFPDEEIFCQMLTHFIISASSDLFSNKHVENSQRVGTTPFPDAKRVRRFANKLEMELDLMWHILPDLSGQASYYLNIFGSSVKQLSNPSHIRDSEAPLDDSQKTLSLPTNSKPTQFIKSPKTSRRSTFSLSWSKKSKKMPVLKEAEIFDITTSGGKEGASKADIDTSNICGPDRVDILVVSSAEKLCLETLPVVFRSTSIRDILNIMALKHSPEEPAKYGLFLLTSPPNSSGATTDIPLQERPLKDCESIHQILRGVRHPNGPLVVYKRREKNLAWPSRSQLLTKLSDMKHNK